MGFWFFSNRKKRQKLGKTCYEFIRSAARNTIFFGPGKVADTVDGRFELLVLHGFLLMHVLRIKSPEERLDQLLFDAMFDDMDTAVRELGTSDTQVGKKIKAMAKAFYGRSRAYHEALDEGSEEKMQIALLRNVMAGAEGEREAKFAKQLSKWVFASEKNLNSQSLKQILRAGPDFAQGDFY